MPCCIIFCIVSGDKSMHMSIICIRWRGSAVVPAPRRDIIGIGVRISGMRSLTIGMDGAAAVPGAA